MLRFLVAATGMSRPQTERLVRQWRDTGDVRDRRADDPGRPFPRRYTPADARMLADVDEAFGQMSGLATREILRRQFDVFGDVRFERLSGLSNGHLYSLRGSPTYRASDCSSDSPAPFKGDPAGRRPGGRAAAQGTRATRQPRWY